MWPKTFLSSLLQDAEAAVLVHRRSRVWCWCMCLGLALMLSGVVVAGAYLYRYYTQEVNKSLYSSEEEPQVRKKKKISNQPFFHGFSCELNVRMLAEFFQMLPALQLPCRLFMAFRSNYCSDKFFFFFFKPKSIKLLFCDSFY